VSRILAIAGSVAADAFRRKVVYVVIFFALLLSIMAPSLPSYGVGVVGPVYREVALAVVFAASLVVTLVLAATRLPLEVERRTAYNVLAKQVHRWEYVAGTWLGVQITLAWVVASFAAIAVAVGFFQYDETMWVLFQGAFGIWLEMGVIAAFAIFVSSRFGIASVILTTLVFMFAAHSRTSLTQPDTLLFRLYPSLDTLNVMTPVSHGSGVTAGYMLTMLVVGFAYVIVLLAFASTAFRGRDI